MSFRGFMVCRPLHPACFYHYVTNIADHSRVAGGALCVPGGEPYREMREMVDDVNVYRL